jgi:hypothetical protein
VKRRDGSICCQVFPLDGRLKMLRDVTGPSFGVVGVRGFAMFKDIKPSPFALVTAEKPTRLDLTQHVPRMDGCYSSRHTIWAPSIAPNLGATLPPAISRRPLICSYGRIRTVDTIILPARLILSPKRTSSMRCAWALLMQPTDLNTLVPRTRNVTNRYHFSPK